MYATSQYVHKTTNEGMSWETIKFRFDPQRHHQTTTVGGPITKDNTSVETYCTIFFTLCRIAS
ncbi:MAG: hypothetical protein IPN94_12860 [Sphingobacteriales bacterium]|nr:hypothetical protein [Sphingobacteriales bacterium]